MQEIFKAMHFFCIAKKTGFFNRMVTYLGILSTLAFPNYAYAKDQSISPPPGYHITRQLESDLDNDGQKEVVIGLEGKGILDLDYKYPAKVRIYKKEDSRLRKVADIETGGTVFDDYGSDYSEQDHTFVIGDINKDGQNDLIFTTAGATGTDVAHDLNVYTAREDGEKYEEIFADGGLRDYGFMVDDFLPESLGKEIMSWDSIWDMDEAHADPHRYTIHLYDWKNGIGRLRQVTDATRKKYPLREMTEKERKNPHLEEKYWCENYRPFEEHELTAFRAVEEKMNEFLSAVKEGDRKKAASFLVNLNNIRNLDIMWETFKDMEISQIVFYPSRIESFHVYLSDNPNEKIVERLDESGKPVTGCIMTGRDIDSIRIIHIGSIIRTMPDKEKPK